MNVDRSSELRVAADFWDDRVLVAATGDLDLISVGPWSALLHAAIFNGDRDLVLDLSAVTFADAAALGVIATICDELSDAGRTVAIRGASATVRRMLEVTGLDAALQLEPPAEDVDPGEEQLVRVASGSTNEIVDAALRLVTTLADATVEHADGVSVTLERHGRLMTVAASNDAVLTMDGHQYDTGEGPCLEAKLDGRWYYIESLADETRWPAFVPLALEQGIHSILSSPLMTADRPLGALNIYSTTVNAFGTHERDLAALFATQASDILMSAGVDDTDEVLSQRFSEALNVRRLIAHAEGALIATEDLDAAAATALLRRRAREANITLAEQASRILARRRDDAGADHV